jgi:mono/diheme cytochrome c family protein
MNTTIIRWIAGVTFTMAIGLFAGAALAESAVTSYDRVLADMGSENFQRWCASCHGDNGRGHGPTAGALKVRPSDLTHIAARRDGKFPAGEIARFIDGRFEVEAHGTREMPVWGQRFGERIPEPGVSDSIVRGRVLVLVEYLKSIQVAD